MRRRGVGHERLARHKYRNVLRRDLGRLSVSMYNKSRNHNLRVGLIALLLRSLGGPQRVFESQRMEGVLDAQQPVRKSNYTARSESSRRPSSTPSAQRLLDGVAMPVLHSSTEP